MLNFISFGSGSSGNCYFLYTETDGLLIDIGIGIRAIKKHFKDYGIPLSSIHNILITHDHADHVKSVGCLSTEFNLPVFTTTLVHDGILRNFCVQKKIKNECKRYIEKNISYQIGEFKVTPFGVPHDSTDNVGYAIEYKDDVFCVITDAGYITDEIKTYINKATFLVIQANYDHEMLMRGPYPLRLKERILSDKGHLSNAECGKALAENMSEKLKKIWLCHVSDNNNHPELARKTVESILASYGIIVGCDVSLDVLKRNTPSGIFSLIS